MEYIHQILNDEQVKTISGYYTIDREMRLEYKGKELLCVLGIGIIDSSCCGVGGCRFALVPGYILKWKTAKNEDGMDITEVEPVSDDQSKQDIKQLLEKEEIITQINFW